MDKKEVDRASFSTKKGQITIFIILGIVILFIFIFMMMISQSITVTELVEEQEEVVGRIFQKEVLRNYVTSCLENKLNSGLVKLGEQGTFWTDDDPAGLREFVPGETGIEVAGKKILYGIVNEDPEKNYPCETEFCYYQFPNITVGFGERPRLTKNTLENDLARYLKTEAVRCVQGWLDLDIPGAELISDLPEIDVKLNENTIKVDVRYPITFKVGGEEFFHLSVFDFSPSSRFKQLVDAAIVFPLQWDQKYVDFDYGNGLENEFFEFATTFTLGDCTEVEGKDYFECKKNTFLQKYNDLEIGMDVANLDNGDDIFTFTSPHIIENELFTFQIARQNRAPALSYINRLACLENDQPYDYLVIEDQEGLDTIDFEVVAHDPDEDDWEAEFETGFGYEYDATEKHFVVDNPSQSEEVQILKIIAKDEHGEKDEQDVRVLVDRSMQSEMKLTMPYLIYGTTPYEEIFSPGNIYFVSLEDPVFIDITLPEYSRVPSTSLVDFFYTNLDRPEQVEGLGRMEDDYLYSPHRNQFCFKYPTGEGIPSCTIDAYSEIELNNWPVDFRFNPFRELTERGQLELNFVADYCGEEQEDTTSIDIKIKECVPHEDPQYPYPYIPGTDFYQSYYPVDEEGNLNLEIMEQDPDRNPFLAAHVCCDNSWNVKDAGEVCFESPQPNCEGNIEEYTAIGDNDGYVLEQKVAYCDGQRGNLCGTEGFEAALWENELRCGDESLYPSCNKVRDQCANQLAWGYVNLDENEGNEGWCYGKMGCESFCESEVVQISPVSPTPNEFAQETEADDLSAWLTCGCNDDNVDFPCDADFDGIFEGTCQSDNSCS